MVFEWEGEREREREPRFEGERKSDMLGDLTSKSC